MKPRVRTQKRVRSIHRWSAEQLHDYVLFLANTGLRARMRPRTSSIAM
jgi:hypothetical protein